MKEVFYTISEVAKMLRVSRPTAYRLVREKRLKGVRISKRRIVVPITEITRLEKESEGGVENEKI